MALQAFTWGSGGEKLTPSQATQRRKMAEALLGPRPAATTFGGGLAEIGNALRGIHAQGQADAADAAHSTQRKAIMDALIANPDPGMADILGALSNDVVTADSGSSAVLQALLNSEMQQNDPLRQQQLAMGELELDALRNPKPEPGFSLLSPEEVAGLGLPDGAYQRGPDNKIYEIGGGGTTINNMGNIPAGYELFTDPVTGASRMQPIAGSPAAMEAEAAANAEALSEERTDLKGGVVVQDIDRALQSITDNPVMTTGIGSAVTGAIPSTPAYNVNALIDTVKANAGFAELQAMRESSPTGGALGNVTEKEIAYLQATIGNLDPRQSPEQLADNLKRVKNAYLDIIHGPESGPPREPLSFEAQSGEDIGPPPEGLSPEEWQFLTPEERALWQN